MKKWVLVCLLALTPSSYADHLYPEPSMYGGDAFLFGYNKELLTVLKDAMDTDVVLRMVEVPSFVPESVVWIEKINSKFEIRAIDPSEPIWGYGQRHAGKVKIKPDGSLDGSDALNPNIDDPARMAVKKCQVNISQDTEQLLAAVWDRALVQVHYDDKQQSGLDGAFFHFAMRKGMQFMAGTVWTPGPTSATGKLVTLAFAMHDYCRSNSQSDLAKITGQASDLLKAMP